MDDNLYLCDPDKNSECRKTSCITNGGPCYQTTNPAFEKKILTNQDRIAETVRTMRPDILAKYMSFVIEMGSCTSTCPVPESYCDRYFVTDENDERIPDEDGNMLTCEQVLTKWLKEVE